MLRNLLAKLKFSQVLANQAVAADIQSAGVDCADFGSMMFLLSVGSFAFSGTNKITVKMQYSDDNVSFADVPVAEMYSSADQKEGSLDGVAQILDSAPEASKVYAYEYRGSKRYARLALVVGGTVSVGASIVACGGHSELMPPL